MPLHNTQQAQDIVPSPDSLARSTTFVPKTLRAHSGISTLDQNALLFDIALEKAKHDFAYGKRKSVAKEAG